jgi:hypothetical protein
MGKSMSKLLVLVGLFGLCLSPSVVRAGGGEGIPSLNDINSMKYELADGESYQIGGVITFLSDGQPYLKVDLKLQPWLATSKRVQFPYYPLTGGADFWKTYNGQKVAYMCIASGQVVGGQYVIVLQPVEGTNPISSLEPSRDRR